MTTQSPAVVIADDASIDDSSATGAVASAVAKLRQMVETSMAPVAECKDAFRGGIREKPFQSVLIASAVGAVVGWIVFRRNR